MNSHPENTSELFEMAGLPDNARIIDLGAGDGSSGCSVCVDIAPRAENVIKADFFDLPFPDESFDAALSQCSFFISGNPQGALREAHRILKPGGKLLLSDVFLSEPELPGFRIIKMRDKTEDWRQYYLEMLWREENVPQVKGKVKYYLIVAEKE